MLTKLENRGLLLESCVDQAFKELEYPVESNPFNPSDWKKCVGRGCYHKGKEILVEDKNYGSYPLTSDMVKEEILSRFPSKRSDKRERILVITNPVLLHRIVKLLRKADVHIVFLPSQVSQENAEKMVKILISRLSLLLRILSIPYNPLRVFISPIDFMLDYLETTSDLDSFYNLLKIFKHPPPS